MKAFGMLVLELTSHCNRSCPWCMRQGDLTSRRFTDTGQPVRKRMPTAECERLLREASELNFRGAVTFYLMSEPYLDERLLDFAEIAKGYGMFTFVNTNGDVLRKRPDLIERSKKAFGWVQVGIYEQDAEKARESVAWWKSKLGAVARFKTLSEMGPRPHVPRRGVIHSEASCFRPHEKLIVQYDGSMPLCCYDINTEFGLPNAFDVRLRDAWDCEARRKAARVLEKRGGRKHFELCSTCPMPESGFPKGFEDQEW